MRGARALLVVLAAALLGAAPSAHLVQTGFGAFYDGIAHLCLTPADLLLVLALGVLAGLRGKEAARPVLFLVPAAWLAAGLLAPRASGAGTLDLFSAASCGLAGLLVALDARLERRALAAIASLAALLHGAANGAASEEPGALPLLGTALACFALLTLTSALVVARATPRARIVARVGGSWIAACGILLCAWQLRAAQG